MIHFQVIYSFKVRNHRAFFKENYLMVKVNSKNWYVTLINKFLQTELKKFYKINKSRASKNMLQQELLWVFYENSFLTNRFQIMVKFYSMRFFSLRQSLGFNLYIIQKVQHLEKLTFKKNNKL